MKDLSPKQNEIYDFLVDFKEKNDFMPTYQEIADGLGTSRQNIVQAIAVMINKGFIRVVSGLARSITIVR
jgi:SOS-response transcriptional repressor LexA